MTRAWGICEVCYLVDGDASEKMVTYCSFCDSWICDNCWWNLPKRGLAMMIKKSNHQ